MLQTEELRAAEEDMLLPLETNERPHNWKVWQSHIVDGSLDLSPLLASGVLAFA